MKTTNYIDYKALAYRVEKTRNRTTVVKLKKKKKLKKEYWRRYNVYFPKPRVPQILSRLEIFLVHRPLNRINNSEHKRFKIATVS